LSERVREIQQRKAREAALEQEAARQAAAVLGYHADDTAQAAEQEADENRAHSLGLVSSRPDAPPLNPLVVAALRRIERARQPAPPASKSRTSQAGAATAAAIAYAPEESYRPEPDAQTFKAPPPTRSASLGVPFAEAPHAPEASKVEVSALKTESSAQKSELPSEVLRAEAARPSAEAARSSSGLVVVSAQQPQPSAKAETVAQVSKTELPRAAKPELPVETIAATAADASTTASITPDARASLAATAAAPALKTTRTTGSLRATHASNGDVLTQKREMEITDAANCVPIVETHSYNDRAPLAGRLFASIADLLIVLFLSAPFAAIIELTSSHWNDRRVLASMLGILVIVMFIYLVVSTGLIGRTLGMHLFSLRAVDARSALVPTTGQSARRAIFYMLSLATFGLGLLYALFDAERRTAHDHLSGTIVVHE
jgi:uncharacterized RDD family membrane protein YckC